MIRILWATLLLFLLHCSKSGDIAGTSTETQTGRPVAAIVGLIAYDTSFTRLVNGADVDLHDQRLVKIITLGKSLALIRSGHTTTNINGFFRFDSVDTGKYLVEVNDHDTLGAILTVTVHPSDTLVVAKGTLHKYGTIVGKIDSSKWKELVSAGILIPELNRRANIDSLGNFHFSNLPEWDYHLLLTSRDSILTLISDTTKVPVVTGDTTRVISLGSKTGIIVVHGTIIERPIQ